MVLLRHWSILESIHHSIDLACLFKVWTNKGKKKLNEFLADLGYVHKFTNLKKQFVELTYKFKFTNNRM
jgi:hypothetical protein